MNLPLELRPEAESDIRSARDWYDRQRNGLGDEFLDSVDALFAAIAQHPRQYAATARGVRRAKRRRFPYVVYYRVLTDCIEVLAILHGRRDPRVWQDRS